ncbi:MAG TPA: hypothetical protein VMV46_02160 [Thermoanaerobaculia bacterium]|nr:hypothetical protein [Thermoanaerobaculia bacterium]
MPARRSLARAARAALVPLLVLLASSPALGGTVYVALAADGEIGGVFYETTLVISNPTDELRFVALDFHPGFVDGKQVQADPKPAIHGLPPRQTRIFTGLTRGLATLGMLEVTGDDLLAVDARLRVTTKGGRSGVIQLPVIGSDHLREPGKLYVLPGWYRDSSRRTSFGLINPTTATSQCTVELFGVSGNSLLGTTVLSVPPVGLIFLSDALGVAGVVAAAEARMHIACDAPWYAYGLVTDLDTGELVRRDAAVDLISTLSSEFADDTGDPGDPGDQPGSGGAGNPGVGVVVETGPGLVRLRVPGVVHAPARGNDKWVYRLELPGISTIDSISATVVVRTGPWGALRSRPQHHLLQISNARWGDGGWDYWVRPDRTDGVVQNGLLVTRGRNAGNEVVRGTLSRLPNSYRIAVNQSGRSVQAEGLRINQGIFPPRSGPLFIQLGADLGASHDPKVPSYGWVWRDLVVEVRGRR